MPVGQSPEAVRATAALRQTETKRRQTEFEADRLALAQRDFALRSAGQRLEQQARQQQLQRQQTRQQLFGRLATEFAPGAFAPRAAVGVAPGAVPQQAPGGVTPSVQQLAAEAGLDFGAAPAGGLGFGIAPGVAAEVLPIIGQLIGAGVPPEQVAEFFQILGQAQAGAPTPAPGPGGPAAAPTGAAQPPLPPSGLPGQDDLIQRFLGTQEERGAGSAVLQEIGLAARDVPPGLEAILEAAAPPVLGLFGGGQRIEALRDRQEAERQAEVAGTKAERDVIQRALKSKEDRDVASTILETTRPISAREFAGPGARLAAAFDPTETRDLLQMATLEGALSRAVEILREIPEERRERIIAALDQVRPGFGQRLAEELAGVPGL